MSVERLQFVIRTSMTAAAAMTIASGHLVAQTPVRIQGVAYDSLRGAPLADAVIAVLGTARTTTTDERGRFSLDSIPAGTRTFIVQHASIDSMGFRGLSRRLVVGEHDVDVRLALPSFRTLWTAACRREPPRDSGFVYGTIRHVATRAPIAHALVEVSWIITTYDRRTGVKQRRVVGEAVTDAHGNYAVCGVPPSHWIKVLAAAPEAAGGVDVPPGTLRVLRRDLLIGPSLEQDSTSRGTILGYLVDQDGVTYSEARVLLDDSTEVRSRGDGRFAFRGIRAGTRQLEIMSIGMVPVVAIVDVLPGDSTSLRYTLRRVTTLDVVQVTASRRGRQIAEGLEERRRRGHGYLMDMTELQAHASFRTVLNEFPGIRVVQQGAGDYRVLLSDGRGGQCSPEVWVDGARMPLATLTMIMPADVMAVEYFARAGMVPLEFRRNQELMTCGAILVWTNRAFSR